MQRQKQVARVVLERNESVLLAELSGGPIDRVHRNQRRRWQSRSTSAEALVSEDQKGWRALTLIGELVGNSQHRPALGRT